MSGPATPLYAKVPVPTKVRWQELLAAAICVLLAAAWGLATTDYSFAEGDDAWQAPMVVHAMDPSLLNRDALVTEVGARYKSLLFPLLAAVARLAGGLVNAYAAGFILNRLLSVAAFAYLTWAATRSLRAAMLSAFLFTGFGYYSFGTYLGGTPLLEEKLVPRAFAVPAVFMALAAMLQGRHWLAASWLAIIMPFHPVTGVNMLGVYLVYALLSYPHVVWKQFLPVTLVLLGYGFALAYWTGALDAAGGQWFVDPRWRAIIMATVGRYVFALHDKSWWLNDASWWPGEFPMALFIGIASALALGPCRWRSAYVKFLAAALAAVLLHVVAVDWLGFHPLLEACPERATMAAVAMAGVGLSLLMVRLFEHGAWGKITVSVLFLAVLFRFDYRVTVLLFLYCLLGLAPRPVRTGAALAGLVFLSIVAVMAWRPSSGGRSLSMAPAEFRGLQALAALGIKDAAKVEVQLWIRDHSDREAILLPPLHYARAWNVFSERACVFNASFDTYTHLSKDLGLRYDGLIMRLYSIKSWGDLESYARDVGADWIIVDDREPLRLANAREVAFRKGGYAVCPVRR